MTTPAPNEVNDGDAAFPVPLPNVGRGMTLRDWFAGQALRAALDADAYSIVEGRRLLAINCYAIADAMLAERSKP